MPAVRHSLALSLVVSPWVATILKGRLSRDCLAKWECARAEGVGLGEREARTAKQPQGPAKVPRGVEIPAWRQRGIVDFLMVWIERENGRKTIV